jgi:hypothetical protein
MSCEICGQIQHAIWNSDPVKKITLSIHYSHFLPHHYLPHSLSSYFSSLLPLSQALTLTKTS